jgi:hypothetical protein
VSRYGRRSTHPSKLIGVRAMPQVSRAGVRGGLRSAPKTCGGPLIAVGLSRSNGGASRFLPAGGRRIEHREHVAGPLSEVEVPEVSADRQDQTRGRDRRRRSPRR